jgi:transposase
MTRETITLTQQEQQRVHVLTQVKHGALTAGAAAQLLELSLRHIRRLLARLRRLGLGALAHGNRGQQSRRRCVDAIRTRVLTLARTRYRGCNDCHFTELLAAREGIHLARPTVQRFIREAGIGSPRTRRPPRRNRQNAGYSVVDGDRKMRRDSRGGAT